jgi:hypothetical protein
VISVHVLVFFFTHSREKLETPDLVPQVVFEGKAEPDL